MLLPFFFVEGSKEGRAAKEDTSSPAKERKKGRRERRGRRDLPFPLSSLQIEV